MMKRFLVLASAIALVPPAIQAQTRAVGAGAFILDDGAGHTVTLQAPANLTQSNYFWTLPTPPTGPAQASGFVPTGSVTGQLLYWNGSQWASTSALLNNSASLGLATSLIPTSDNLYNIGDATHSIDTLFVKNIVGVAIGGGGGGGTSVWQRTGTTVSPLTSGDNESTSGQLQLVGTNGTTSFAAANQSGSNITYTLPASLGAANAMLTNDGSGTLSWSSPIKFAMKTAAQNFGTYANDNDLSFSVGANETYTIEGMLSVTDINFGGISAQVGFTIPAGATLKFGAMSTASNQGVNIGTSTVTQIPIYANGTGPESAIYIKGVIVNGATAGTLQFKAASSQGASNPLRIQPNSYIQLTRVK